MLGPQAAAYSESAQANWANPATAVMMKVRQTLRSQLTWFRCMSYFSLCVFDRFLSLFLMLRFKRGDCPILTTDSNLFVLACTCRSGKNAKSEKTAS